MVGATSSDGFQLRIVWQSLTLDARRTLSTAFTASRLDYCNAVLYGATAQVMRRLQMVYDDWMWPARAYITPVLCDVLY